MPDDGHHLVGKLVHRYEMPEELKAEGLDGLEAVYYEYADGERLLMAYTRKGEGRAVAEAFDIAWCNAPTPAVQKMVQEAVLDRVEELIALGFQAGLEFCRSGNLPIPTIELEET